MNAITTTAKKVQNNENLNSTGTLFNKQHYDKFVLYLYDEN